jgi:hypothetical protein
VLDKWYTATQAACDGSTCSVTPSVTLGGGAHSWWIQTYNSAGLGPWSSGLSFNTTSTVPAAAAQVYPEGDIGADYTPTYEWSDVSDATWYRLYVNGPSGNVVDEWYSTTEAACDGLNCSVTPDTPLGGGTHSWWVQTYSSIGYGPWSSGMSFTTTAHTVPDAATQNLPVGDIGTDYTPTYEWNEVPGATWYHLYVNGPSGNVLDEWYTATQAACDGFTCSVTPSVTLGGGAHSWWIQTYNSAGLGPWSSGLSFNTTIPTPPGPVP